MFPGVSMHTCYTAGQANVARHGTAWRGWQRPEKRACLATWPLPFPSFLLPGSVDMTFVSPSAPVGNG